MIDSRLVTLDTGDGFPVTLTIDQARAVRGALAALNLVDNTEYSTHEDESHTKNIDGVYIVAAVITGDRPTTIDLDAPLDLDVIDDPVRAQYVADRAEPDTNGTIYKSDPLLSYEERAERGDFMSAVERDAATPQM